MLGPWRWKESVLRKKVVTGPRLIRVLSVLNPELRLPERPELRAPEGSRKGAESKDDAPNSDGEAGAAQPTIGRGRAPKKVGARKPVDTDSPHAKKRARRDSPEPSAEVVSASDEEDAASAGEEAHDTDVAGPSVVPDPLAPLSVRTVDERSPDEAGERLASAEDLNRVDLGMAEFDRPIQSSDSKGSLAGIFVVDNDDEFGEPFGSRGMSAIPSYPKLRSVTKLSPFAGATANPPAAHPPTGGRPEGIVVESAAPGPEPSNLRSGKGKGLFTGTLQNGIEPRAVGNEMMRQDFETRPGTAAPLGLLTEVIDSLELEHNLETVSSKVLTADLAKLALKVSSETRFSLD